MFFADASSNAFLHTEQRCPRDLCLRHFVHITLPSLRGNQRMEDALRPSFVPQGQEEHPGQTQPSFICCGRSRCMLVRSRVYKDLIKSALSAVKQGFQWMDAKIK
jgi:hypothetical protein